LGHQNRFAACGIATLQNGAQVPFSLSISEPYPHERYGWQCAVQSNLFHEEPFSITGDEPEFAWCLALGFVHRMLEYKDLSLATDTGEPVTVPEPEYSAWGIDRTQV